MAVIRIIVYPYQYYRQISSSFLVKEVPRFRFKSKSGKSRDASRGYTEDNREVKGAPRLPQKRENEGILPQCGG